MNRSHRHLASSNDSPGPTLFYLAIGIAALLFFAGLFASSRQVRDGQAGFPQSIFSGSSAGIPAIQGQSPEAVSPQSYLPVMIGPPQTASGYPIVFVSRQIPGNGSTYYPQGGSMPGVGPYSRFQVAAPGKLLIREPNGKLRTLIDGANPRAASLYLIDVNAPDVSYDGKKIVFAGLPQGSYSTRPRPLVGAWRIYSINVDGSGLKQVTFSDLDLDLSQFDNQSHWRKYDDTDPVWLPDGRIVFSSTRWPSIGMYQDSRTTNLYVVNANGSGVRRITAERNGADRPLVDPLTGKIVYSRWWRNFRNATNDMSTVEDPIGGYIRHLGLVAESKQGEYGELPGINLIRNSWMLATINPDGTGLAQWAGVSGIGYDAIENQAYGGSFAPDGSLYTSFFPMANLTEAAGFGGIRRFERGPHGYKPTVGITDDVGDMVASDSFHVYKGAYASEPEVVPDGTLILSRAGDTRQDYGLYTANANGSGLKLLYDNPGTSELRARLVRPRPRPPVVPDQVTKVASLLPPLEDGPYDIDGTFTFNALNVYFNAPVDMNIASAMAVGSAGSIRFFIDHQRSPGGGFAEFMDWPILMQELPVSPDGAVKASLPANVPLFEQIRTPLPDYTVPVAGTSPDDGEKGAAHVAGLNFGRPGIEQRCVGCHAGHSMIPVPDSLEAARWTNLAPGAAVEVSSSDSTVARQGLGLVDRRVHTGQSGLARYWLSKPGQATTSQWVKLTFPVPVTVRVVRLYNVPQSGTSGDLQVQDATVRLYSDAQATHEVATSTSGALSEWGTDVAFDDVAARVVRIEFDSVTGSVAGLAEVEVIAQGAAGP